MKNSLRNKRSLLNPVVLLLRKIEKLNLIIESLDISSFNSKSGNPNTRVQSSTIHKPTENTVIKMESLKETSSNLYHDLEISKINIQNVIKKMTLLTKEESKVLYHRYVCGYLWDDVADYCIVSRSEAHIREKSALDKYTYKEIENLLQQP